MHFHDPLPVVGGGVPGQTLRTGNSNPDSGIQTHIFLSMLSNWNELFVKRVRGEHLNILLNRGQDENGFV